MTATTTPDLDAIERAADNILREDNALSPRFFYELLALARAQQQQIAELEAERDALQCRLDNHEKAMDEYERFLDDKLAGQRVSRP